MDEYEYLECCASGNCEVCGGLQGVIRAEVVTLNTTHEKE